jgi:hypothetical protein
MLGRAGRRLRARYSILSVATDAPNASIPAGTQSHTRTRVRPQAAESTPTGTSSARSRARLARQEAMSSPLHPVTRSTRPLPRTADNPAAAMSRTARHHRSAASAPSTPATMSSPPRVTRSMSRQLEAATGMVPQTPMSTAHIPTTPLRRSPRKRTRDDDHGSTQQAREGKKARIS